MRRFLWIFLVLLLGVPALAQTQKPYPGVDLPNVWTEPNTFMQIIGTPTTFAGLGSPSGANSYSIRWISDSTSVTVQGQPCVGGGTEKALAFSNGTTWACFSVISGGSGGNQAVSFTNQTTVSVVAQGGTANVVWDCWDGQSPAAHTLLPSDVSINTLNFLMTFTFATPKSGFCVINSGRGGGGGGGGGGSILFQNNGVTLPFEPFANCVAPMLCADNPANTRIDISTPVAVGVGGSHASGLVPDPQASGASTDYLGRDMSYHTSSSAATVKPDPATGIQYAAQICNGGGACSDANDGLSWGTAKLTPYAALLALPNGSASPPTAGNGIVYVANDLNGIAFGGPVPGGLGGWWMFGPGDPGYAGGVTGWMRAPLNLGTVTLECAAPTGGIIHQGGAACLEFWGGHTDNVHPAIWFSQFSGQAVLRGFGFNYQSNPFKVGIDSTNSRSSNSITSVLLDSITNNMGNCYSGIGAGPGLDIGGQSFWIVITHSSFSGCVTQDYTASAVRSSNVVTLTLNQSATGDIVAGANNYIIVRNMTDPTFNGAYVIASASGASITYAQNGPDASTSGGQVFPYGSAAIGINSGSGAGAGFIYVDNSSTNNGTIWAQGGFNGVGLSVNELKYEGAGTQDAAIVELLPTTKNGDTTVYINDVQYADIVPGNGCGVESTGFGNISAQNTTVCGSMGTAYGEFNGTVSPRREGLSGIVNNTYVGGSDSGRRMFSPYAVRFPNLANSNAFWAVGSVTQTNGILAPDGTTQASRLNNATGSPQNIDFATTNITPQVGSTYVFSTWMRSGTAGTAAPALRFTLNENGGGAGDFCNGAYYGSAGAPGSSATAGRTSVPITGDGEWAFYSGACKIVTAPNGGFQVLELTMSANTTIDVYGPVMALVPANTISDNEISELVNNLQSYPPFSAAVSGDVSMMPGQRFVMATPGNLFMYFMQSSATANRTITWPDASGTVGLFTGSITPGSNVCASGAIGLITTIGCTGGGGGSGTVNNASQWSIGNYVNAGSSNFIGGIPAPTTPDLVPQFLISKPSSGATQAGFALAGIPVLPPDSSANYNVTAINRNSLIIETLGAPGTTFQVPSSLFTSGFAFKVGVRSLNSTVAITPSSGTCNGSATCTMVQGENAVVTLDDTGGNLLADIHDPPLVCLVGCTLTPGDYSLGLSVTGAVAGTGTVGSLAKFVTNTTTIGNADLSGDVTTSGTVAATVVKVNGVAYGASPSTNTVPVVTGSNTVTYEAVPAAAIVGSGATTPNGQTCTLGSTCNVNSGAANHSLSINKGAGAAIAGLALTNQQIASGSTGADPVAYNLSELSATLDGGTAAGTVNALTACSTPAAAALHTGQVIELLPSGSNTVSNPTLLWCGIGSPLTITSFGTTLAAAGGTASDLQSRARALLLYNGTGYELQNPQTNQVGAGVTWDAIGNAANSKVFSNAAFTTEFDQTTSALWTWWNKTPATVTVPQPAPQFLWKSEFWGGGGADTAETWTLAPVLVAGLNGLSKLTFSYSGSTAGGLIDMSSVNLRIPRANSFVATTNNMLGFDGLASNLHTWCSGLDCVVAAFTGGVATDGNIPIINNASGTIALVGNTGLIGANVVTSTTTTTTNQVMLGNNNRSITASASIPSAITATTQTGGDNSTKISTTAYVDAHYIANGATALGTSAISSGACVAVGPVSATGVATTDVIIYTPAVDPTTLTTSYGPSATGSLYIWAYPTTNNVNFKICNNTASTITQQALTVNWKVVR